MKKYILIVLLSFFLIPLFSYADETDGKMKNLDRIQTFGEQGTGFFLPADFKNEDTQEKISRSAALFIASPVILLIQILYGFLATILVLLILKGGYIWLTSQGNEEKTKKALDTIKQAIIGFAILLGSVIIIYFVLLLLGQVNVGIIGSDASNLE